MALSSKEELPVEGSLLSAEIKDVFNTTMDGLLKDLGRVITLNLKPTKEDCPNCSFDTHLQASNRRYNSSNPNLLDGPLHKVFLDGQRCPVCENKGMVLTPRTTQFTATISKKFTPEELLEAGIGKLNKNGAKTNTVLASYNDIIECESALIDGKLYKRTGEAIKTGLQQLIRVKQFWERVD